MPTRQEIIRANGRAIRIPQALSDLLGSIGDIAGSIPFSRITGSIPFSRITGGVPWGRLDDVPNLGLRSVGIGANTAAIVIPANATDWVDTGLQYPTRDSVSWVFARFYPGPFHLLSGDYGDVLAEGTVGGTVADDEVWVDFWATIDGELRRVRLGVTSGNDVLIHITHTAEITIGVNDFEMRSAND